MNHIEQIKKVLERFQGKWHEKRGVWEFSTTIAERKAFLSKKQLTYSMRIKIDEITKTVKFSEMLIEAGSGFSSGDFDGGMSTGMGFKTESYNTLKGPRQGTIEEQSTLFGKSYSYSFDFNEIRQLVKAAAEADGYVFEYQVLPLK